MSHVSLSEDYRSSAPQYGGYSVIDILIVDDEPAVADIAAETLSGIGHRIAYAHNGSEALALMERNFDIELLFTDVVMPGMHGFMLADMVKACRPSVKVLYATGYANMTRDLRQAGRVHGPILFKPYRPAELERAVREVMSGACGTSNQ